MKYYKSLTMGNIVTSEYEMHKQMYESYKLGIVDNEWEIVYIEE